MIEKGLVVVKTESPSVAARAVAQSSIRSR